MIYLDNAATSRYKPPCVVNSVKNALKYLSANPGRSGHTAALQTAMLVANTRERAAAFFGCDNSDLAVFTYNCTDALNMAIFGSHEKGHVITTANEHNSVLRPLFELERKKLIRLTVLAPDREGIVTPKMIADNLRPDTYLVCVNHVSNVTGAISPVEDIGKITRPRRILFLVDAAQSAGHFPIDMAAMCIDMLAVAGHKGLHGPQGIGLLLMSGNVKLRPTRFGGTGTDSQNIYHPDTAPEAFEAGTVGSPAIAGLNGGIRWTEKHMAENARRVAELCSHLLPSLAVMPGIKLHTPLSAKSGVVSFNIVNMNSQDVCNILCRDYDIYVRGGLHCAPLIHRHLDTLSAGAVRVSMCGENTEEEINFLLKAISEIAG